MHLDDETRSRLRALADASRGELDEAARGRIARQVASAGPRVLRRARIKRAGTQVAAVVAVLGAIAYRLLAAAPQVATHDVPRIDPGTPAPAAPAGAPQRACEQREAPEPQWIFAGARAHVDLGQVGALAVDDGAQLWIDASERCRLRLRLLAGRVSVHAADLGGGELRVTTPSGDVVVHGTTFGVAHDESGLTVDVDEGRVAVQSRGNAGPRMVDAGQRLRAAAAREPQIEPLAASDRDALRAALAEVAGQESSGRPLHAPRASAEPRVAPQQPVPSAAALVAEADALWRRGERDAARDRYRQAGALTGPTAEAAWLALARRELSVKAPAAARAALEQYRARFARGKLAAEADGIAFRAALEQGDLKEARRVAERLVASAPDTPQAEAAQRWLKSQR